MTTLVACSHGTADPSGQASIRALISEVRVLLPHTKIVAAVVDVEQPQIDEVIARESALDDVIVVPLLLSVGYHTAVDISRAVHAHANVRQTAPLGTHPLITDVLVDRLSVALPGGWLPGDHVVLAAAGSSNTAALDDVECVAAQLRDRIPVPLTVGYASASIPRITDAVALARVNGACRVIAASHVLAPGFFAGLVSDSGADIVSAPLAPDLRIARVVVDRFHSVLASV
ncbi:cobalamin biosynthesis protein CbiX [Microbacterium sp. CH12i]|uniref:sirohydrochlorin chelatase n=1 Tax=Microbacterium sp. CH12i TaxID=1479651 RepID=UPI000460D4A1|nr:CbiX/SirB N-terminal domain-containing protein [Microbacterium sp. CH12i]KDA05643.1 cobalamin biosynthesis protein CbiX [Microbacterium sp. CH12i]